MFRLQQVHRWTTNKKTVPLGTVHFILVKSKKGSDHSEPLMSMAGVVGFEPTRGGFRIRCLNRTWLYPSPWCGRRDSNSHGSHHSDLNAARLPISPRPRPDLFPTDVHPKKRGHQQRRCILPRNFVRGGLIRVFTTRHTIFMGCRLFDR